MFHTVKNGLLAAAVIGLLIAQPAMATRSADSLPATAAKEGSVKGKRVGATVCEAESLSDAWTIFLTATSAVILGALIISDGNDSPG